MKHDPVENEGVTFQLPKGAEEPLGTFSNETLSDLLVTVRELLEVSYVLTAERYLKMFTDAYRKGLVTRIERNELIHYYVNEKAVVLVETYNFDTGVNEITTWILKSERDEMVRKLNEKYPIN